MAADAGQSAHSIAVENLIFDYPTLRALHDVSFTVAKGEAFAVLNYNRPEFYVVPAAAYAALLDRIEALENAAPADPGLNLPPA